MLPWRRTAHKMAGFVRTMTGREGEKDKRYIQPRPPECSQSAAAVRRDRRHRSSRSSKEKPLRSSAEIAWTNSGLRSNRSSLGSGSHWHKANFQHALRQETHTNISFSIAFTNDPFQVVRETAAKMRVFRHEPPCRPAVPPPCRPGHQSLAAGEGGQSDPNNKAWRIFGTRRE